MCGDFFQAKYNYITDVLGVCSQCNIYALVPRTELKVYIFNCNALAKRHDKGQRLQA